MPQTGGEMTRIAAYLLAAIVGLGIGSFSALSMAGLLPGDRRAAGSIDIDGWRGDLTQGSADASPYFRARVARHGLLALAKSEAIYFIRDTDEAGRRFTEDCTYRVTGGAMPAGWWSITLYNAENFLPDNNDNALSFDASRADSVEWEAMIAPTEPEDRANWISSRNSGEFDLTLRLYMPEEAALARPSEAISPPRIERVKCTESQ